MNRSFLPLTSPGRRALLAGVAASLAAGCMPTRPDGALQGRRVLVIGAGFAGLSAARALRQSGAEVVVLEARDRPGGRVLTDRSCGFPLDLGPSWLHGGPRNPIKLLAEGSGVATRVTDYANFRFTNASSGRPVRIAPTELIGYAQKFSKAMESMSLWLELTGRAAGYRANLSVADVFGAAVKRIEAREGPIDRGVVALQRWVLESNLAAPLEEIGAEALLYESDTDEDDAVLPPDDRYVVDGMDRLIALLALDLDIRYGQTVRAIRWRPGNVGVATAHDNWTADSVIITLPVGVLANGDVQFAPDLPASFTVPLGHLRMGLLNKVCLVFPRAFWNPQVDFLTFFSDPPPLCYAWLNMMRYSGAPALLGFTAGNAARQVETMSDDQIVTSVMQRVRRGRPRVPDPLEVRVSRWAADPLARGSYSFPGIGGSGKDRDRLAVPVENTLFFAGEATHRDDPASVHGAWWSGLRAANQVLGNA